jgi:hypothetical protein
VRQGEGNDAQHAQLFGCVILYQYCALECTSKEIGDDFGVHEKRVEREHRKAPQPFANGQATVVSPGLAETALAWPADGEGPLRDGVPEAPRVGRIVTDLRVVG